MVPKNYDEMIHHFPARITLYGSCAIKEESMRKSKRMSMRRMRNKARSL